MSKPLLIAFGLCFGAMIGFSIANPESSVFQILNGKPKLEISYQDRDSKQKFEISENDFQFGEPSTEKQSPFVINGVNKTSTIEGLTTLAGKSIAELETQMRPGASGPAGSVAGFLGQDESLLQVIADDNQWVV